MYKRAFQLVDELKIKIEQLLTLSDLDSLDSESQEILTLVYNHLDSFEETAKTTLLSDLDRAICSEVFKLRGIVAQIAYVEFSDGEVEEEEGFQFGIDDVEGLKQRIDSFNRQLKMEELRCSDGLYNSFPDEDEEDNCDADAAVTSEMIGMSDVYEQLKHKILRDDYFSLISLVGMPGIGKTTLARKLFHDPNTSQRFDHRVWIRVGKTYRTKDIPRRILAEIDPDALPGVDDEEAVHDYLNKILKSESYLIVIDDVWDKYIHYLWHPLFRYEANELNHPFLHSESGSCILFVSRLQQLSYNDNRCGLANGVVAMRLLNKKESWDLFRDKVFGKGSSCPPQLLKPGKKISDKCEGLPLTILTVARLLSDEDKSNPDYWNEVAAKRNHPVFTKAYDVISKVMLPSYTYLPPLLKMCFLYIGLFPPSSEIPRSKLINLWFADRFLELNLNINSYLDAIYCLEEVVSNSVVMVYKKSTKNPRHTIKTCGLHPSLWHMSKQKATESKFALIISCPEDCIGDDDMEGHHRLSILYNVLFGMKEVHKSVEDNCASAARSLLCFGSYHQFQVPLCFRLKFLRELDALSIRFYEFPVEVLQLVQLTYLSLTSNGMIPASICQLQLLEFFIVDRHESIKYCKEASYLPVEIWRLSALKHLEVVGSDLPDPDGASLDSLLTLSKVSARSCSEAVLKGVPNVRELYIQIELAPDGDGKPLISWAHISHCRRLESLKCVIVNPDVVPPVVRFSSFAENHFITNLYLSGLSYPWEEMSEIASLPCLMVLKLKSNAFQGPEWEVVEGGFNCLITLVIEDADMVDWKIGFGAFEKLESLIIRNCYKLEKIHGKFGEDVSDIEIVDCNPRCIKEMKKALPTDEEEEEGGVVWVLNVHSSWDEKKKLETTYASPSIKVLRS